VLYNWDLWLLDKDTPGFELQSHGIKELATAPQCRDGSCVPFTNGTYLQLPAHNFGQYAGLTFALWFKPTSASGSDARIVDFGRGADQDNIVIARKGSTSDLLLSVRVTAQNKLSTCVSTSSWTSNVWRHVVWTLAPTSAAPPYTDSLWEVYIDGEWRITCPGTYPVNADVAVNYFGKSSLATTGAFVGYLDTFIIYQMAVPADQVPAIYKVSCTFAKNQACVYALRIFSRCFFSRFFNGLIVGCFLLVVYVCMYVCLCVCMFVYVCPYKQPLFCLCCIHTPIL